MLDANHLRFRTCCTALVLLLCTPGIRSNVNSLRCYSALQLSLLADINARCLSDLVAVSGRHYLPVLAVCQRLCTLLKTVQLLILSLACLRNRKVALLGALQVLVALCSASAGRLEIHKVVTPGAIEALACFRVGHHQACSSYDHIVAAGGTLLTLSWSTWQHCGVLAATQRRVICAAQLESMSRCVNARGRCPELGIDPAPGCCLAPRLICSGMVLLKVASVSLRTLVRSSRLHLPCACLAAMLLGLV
jgi:hypothetical protein